jgi:hypothetical protein
MTERTRLANLELKDAVRLRWTLHDIKSERTEIAPVSPDDLSVLIDREPRGTAGQRPYSHTRRGCRNKWRRRHSIVPGIGGQAVASESAYAITRRTTEPDLDKREQYVAFATHCLQLAKVTSDGQSRAILREMPAERLNLAEAASKSDDAS